MAKQEPVSSITSVFLLLRPKDGRKRPSRKIVPVYKGDLIEEFPQPYPADQHSGEHNFHVLNDPSTSLWCDPTDIAPLAECEHHYLLAVSPGHRIKEFHNRDKKEYVMNLMTGDKVSFKNNEGILVKGRIRYLGPVEGKIGVYLGVEIDQDDEYRGKGTTNGLPYFRCGHKNAVWVSMDMVIYPPPIGRRTPRNSSATSKSSSDTGQQTPREHTPAHKPSSETDQYVHLRHNDAEPQQGSKEVSRAKKMVAKAWNYLTGNAAEAIEQQHSEAFKEGDHVVAYSLMDQRPITATVRWTGMVKLSQEGSVPKAMFAGLETDAEIDPDKEFPGMHINLSGPTWGDFLARSGRIKLYLPMSMLIKATNHIEIHGKLCQSKLIAENLNMTESQVVDGELSNVDIQEQEKLLAEAKAQHDAQKQNRREFFQAEEDLVAGTGKPEKKFSISDVTPSMVDEQKAELERLKKEKNEKEMGATRKPYNKAVRGQMPHTATPVSHCLTDGAGLQHNGSTLLIARYPAVTVQAEAEQYHAKCVEAGYQHQDSHNRQDYSGDYRQQHPNSHQSDLSAGYHNQRRPSNDQQYQNQIIAHLPGLQHQGSRPDRELQQYLPYDAYQDYPALAIASPNYDGVQGGLIAPLQPQSRYHHPPTRPAAMQNTEDEHHHRHLPRIHPHHTAAEKQWLVDQIPDWLTRDSVVGVKIPGVREPVTGIVKFVGVVQVKGVNQLITGVQLNKPMVGCTDGKYEGKRLFFCPAETAYFCSIGDLLELKSMYPDNPLSKYACFEKKDQLGGPALCSQYIGEPRGIQGHHNSCYLDSTVFGLFALSDAFDTMFLDATSQSLTHSSDQEEKFCMKAKNMLWKGIVNPLRKNGIARFESVVELRNCLEHLGTMLGANKDEEDPEEFLNMLFKKVLHVRPFISIRRPFGVEEEYYVQLFFEINPEQNVIPFTEEQLWNMFKEQNMSLTEIPSKLLLQMPRFGKDFKMYNRIFPSLTLDVAPILDPTSSRQSLPVNFPLICRLQLLSVICIETSHYVCFTRCDDRWLFHDSMADRIADMYIPRVTEVTQELNEWVYSGNVERLMNSKSWDIPECVRRFTQDAYMCVYVSSELDMCGDPHHEQLSDEVAILKQEKKSLETTLIEKKTALSQAQQSVSQLQSQLEAVTAEKQTTITLLQQQTQENTRLQRENARLQKQDDNHQREVACLQEDNDQKQKQVTNLQSRLAQQPKVVPDSDISFWLVSRDEVHSTSQVLGEGAWGKVTVGSFRGQKVAIKEIHSTIRSEHNDELVYREISLMAKVRHPNLLLFIAAVQNTPSRIDPIFITELLDTDLRKAYQDGQLPNNRVRISILRDVAAALNYLHLQHEPIIHRDVSSANVLLQALPNNWWRGKLSDFGSANLVRDATTAAPGAAVYCAPEASVEGKQSPKIDVYSYGKLFCEVFTSQFPYTKAFPSMLQSMARSWPLMHKIIIRCVEHDPVNRPTMSSIVDQLNIFTQ